jgi:hypothetical protein
MADPRVTLLHAAMDELTSARTDLRAREQAQAEAQRDLDHAGAEVAAAAGGPADVMQAATARHADALTRLTEASIPAAAAAQRVRDAEEHVGELVQHLDEAGTDPATVESARSVLTATLEADKAENTRDLLREGLDGERAAGGTGQVSASSEAELEHAKRGADEAEHHLAGVTAASTAYAGSEGKHAASEKQVVHEATAPADDDSAGSLLGPVGVATGLGGPVAGGAVAAYQRLPAEDDGDGGAFAGGTTHDVAPDDHPDAHPRSDVQESPAPPVHHVEEGAAFAQEATAGPGHQAGHADDGGGTAFTSPAASEHDDKHEKAPAPADVADDDGMPG